MSRFVLPGMERPRRRRRRDGPVLSESLEVVLVDTTRCPACGSTINVVGSAQPALFYFGGLGATVLRTVRRCSRCGWRLPADEVSLNPRH